jgi:hypothetical protein
MRDSFQALSPQRKYVGSLVVVWLQGIFGGNFVGFHMIRSDSRTVTLWKELGYERCLGSGGISESQYKWLYAPTYATPADKVRVPPPKRWSILKNRSRSRHLAE